MVFAYPETSKNYNVEKNENVKYTNNKHDSAAEAA